MELKGSKKAITVKIAALVFVVAAIVFALVLASRYVERIKAYDVQTLTNEDLDEIIDARCNKLMIVAHPDDDALWGGGHLMEGGYLVVCITNGRNHTRNNEFTKVIESSGNKPLILDYPDKVNGKRDEWEEVKDKIITDISSIINYKKWELIVTHNPNGEYGHIHHKMTNRIVTDIFDKLEGDSKLYYFGKYYKAVDLPNVKDKLIPISDEQLKFKQKLLEIYESQAKTLKGLEHMVPYEEWYEYNK